MSSPPHVPDRESTTPSMSAPTPGQTPPQRWPSVRFLGLSLWVAIAVLLVIALLDGPVNRTAALWAQGASWAAVAAVVRVIAYLVILVGIFWLGARVIDSVAARGFLQARPAVPTPEGGKAMGIAFPVHPTIPIGAWLTLITVVLVVALIETLAPSFYILERFPDLSCGTGDQRCVDRHNLLVSIFAAGVGAMVTTVAGYLEHASEKKDFELSYSPWYFARPATGMLLGIVYYFVMKGGVFMTVGEVQSTDLNPYGIAAVAALVGLFSKQATEKLRETFETLFITRSQVKDEVARESKEAQDRKKEGAAAGQPERGEVVDRTSPTAGSAGEASP